MTTHLISALQRLARSYRKLLLYYEMKRARRRIDEMNKYIKERNKKMNAEMNDPELRKRVNAELSALNRRKKLAAAHRRLERRQEE